MSSYELTAVYTPGISEAKLKKAQSGVKALVTKLKGKTVKVDNWGKRLLAYEIKNHSEAVFVHWKLDLKPVNAEKISSKLRLNEDVIRFLLVKNIEIKPKKGKKKISKTK